MSDKDRSCCRGGTKVILACCGASNVGQLTNEVAKRLDGDGEARFFCLAGVGGHVSGMVASVKGADEVLVLDGCPVACAKECMDEAGLPDYQHVVMTELGIEKNHEFNLSDAEMTKALAACRRALNDSDRPSGGGAG